MNRVSSSCGSINDAREGLRQSARFRESTLTKRCAGVLLPVIAVFLAAAINTFLLVNAYVPSSSMEPTLDSGAMVLGDRLAYKKSMPQAGDIIFFHHPDAGKELLLVKRVIAVSGQTFALKSGRVYVDGHLLNEEYVDVFSDDDYPPTVVPNGAYIVLGDNRRESNDSRFWDNPFVRLEDVGAKGMFEYFPKFEVL